MDGTTDPGNQEDELFVVLYCFKDDEAQEITAHTRYLSVHTPQKADATGLISCVNDALQVFGIGDVLNKDSVLCVEKSPGLVSGGTDGASVNVGVHTGMMGQMQRALPWLYWSWCYTHRLELACKDAFTSSLFSNISEMLLRLYYVYEKSAKSQMNLQVL